MMIVPTAAPGATDLTNQYGQPGMDTGTILMALAHINSIQQQQPQSAEPAPQSHKSIREQLKGKIA